MDIITQGLLGAAIAEAGWRQRLGPWAIGAGVLFGLMPDFDVVARAWGEWSSMVHHRGFTHSIFFAPLIAPWGGWAFWRLSGRRARWRSWTHLVFWALLTHPLLDVFTSYGTQLLAPLSDRRFALDGISIVDPIYTLPLLFALLFAWFTRRDPARGRRAARAALALTTAYIAIGVWNGAEAREAARSALLEARVDKNAAIRRVRAMPTLANVLLWRVVARDEAENTYIGLHSRAAPEVPIRFSVLPRLDSPLVDRALVSERGRLMRWFADDWLTYRIEERGADLILSLDDQRYGGIERPTRSMWGAEALVGVDGELGSFSRTRFGRPDDFGAELEALWRAIWDGPPPPT